jgi:two-component system sensor histidine kinase DegS
LTATRSEQHYRQLFDSAPICLMEVDLDQDPPRVLAANACARRLGGASGEALVGQPLDQLFPPTGAARMLGLVSAVRAGRSMVFETTLIRLDGSTLQARLNGAPIGDADRADMILAIEDIAAEQERRSELAAIDEDRRRIAHELHDVLAQNLAALRLRAARWGKLLDSDPERLRAELDGLLVELKADIQEARRAIFALRPIALDEAGFGATLEQLVEDMQNQYRFEVRLRMDTAAGEVPATLELPLLRMVQEALNNVGRHAEASIVLVELSVAATDIRLTVRDNGSGFDDAVGRPGRYGLVQMRERAASYGGSCHIESRAGTGTTVRVVLPMTVG